MSLKDMLTGWRPETAERGPQAGRRQGPPAATPAAEPKASHARHGHSAYGEDVLMQGWLNHYGVAPDRIRDLDIGAAIPAHLNITFLFNSVGACGFLVESDPDQAAVLRTIRTMAPCRQTATGPLIRERGRTCQPTS